MNETSVSDMFRCDTCCAIIKDESTFWNHVSTQHLVYYPYRCGYCAETGENHSTTTEDKIKLHLKTIHRGKDLRILVHKKHDIETQLQTIVEKCRLKTENSPVGLKCASRQSYNALDEGFEFSIRSRGSREAISSLPKQREGSIEASETTIDDTSDTITAEDQQGKSANETLTRLSSKMESQKEASMSATYHRRQTKLISITVVDENSNVTEQCLPGIQRCNSEPTFVEARHNLPQYGFEEIVDENKTGNDTLANETRQNQNPEGLKRESGNKVSVGRNAWKGRVSKHQERQLHKCDQCSFSSIKNSHLVAHMRVHASRNIRQCDQCPYITNNSEHLQRHVRIHTGEKPFKCGQCFYASAQKATLKAHIRAYHV